MATAIVPLKLKSRRLPNKNFLILGDKPLASYIFETLLKTPKIEQVYCYTSQPKVLSLLPYGVRLLPRPSRLDGDDVKANELFRYAVDILSDEIIVICQVPGPFVKSESISKAIEAISSGLYDSAFAVRRIQTYCWYKSKPVNYNPYNMVQTQNLDPVYAETSGFYAFKRSNYLSNNTRISGRSLLVEVSDREAIDIDDPKDFSLALRLLDYDEDKCDFTQDAYLVNLARASSLNETIRHVAFDLDGVLIDSLDVMKNAWKQATESVNLSVAFSLYAKEIGRAFFDILNRLGIEKKYHADLASAYECSASKNIQNIKIAHGINEALKKIKSTGVKISIVTSKSEDRAKAILNAKFPNIQFDAVVTPECVADGRGKPNPDQLLVSCIKVGVDPNQTIYIGDMDVDRLTAKRAGTHFVHASWGYGDLATTSDIWFDSVENFTEFLTDTLILQKTDKISKNDNL